MSSNLPSVARKKKKLSALEYKQSFGDFWAAARLLPSSA